MNTSVTATKAEVQTLREEVMLVQKHLPGVRLAQTKEEWAVYLDCAQKLEKLRS